MLGLEECVIPIDEVDVKSLMSMVSRLLEKRDAMHAHLRQVVPEIKRRAAENARLVQRLLHNHSPI